MDIVPIKRALLSVSDKTGVIELAKSLNELKIKLISTGGTSQLLAKEGIPHKQVEEITGLPEMLDGRVKTLHPKVHGGILGKRDKHSQTAQAHGIEWIDLVVVNFYPFIQATATKDMTLEQAIEYIDIGGPTMVRAAAKNLAWVGVVTDPMDYAEIVEQIRAQGGLTQAMRQRLATKVFDLTARYDAAIASYLNPQAFHLHLEKTGELRYGENPHQKASAYKFDQNTGILAAKQHQGKPLSYNNILDSEAALNCVREFDAPACVIVKHANPCGAATGETIDLAFERALNADPVSAFGGIIALNRTCTKAIAEKISAIFMEVIIAPSYTPESLTIFESKKNLRVLEVSEEGTSTTEIKFINGGVLVQDRDQQEITAADLQIVTEHKPSEEDINSMLFAWRVLKHIKSNGILIAKDNVTVGIGAGQVSRIDAVDLAIRKAQEKINDTVLASDAFFPFRDSIDRLAKTGVRAIVQPGGSIKDPEVIAACNEHGIAMVFTGKRCFKH